MGLWNQCQEGLSTSRPDKNQTARSCPFFFCILSFCALEIRVNGEGPHDDRYKQLQRQEKVSAARFDLSRRELSRAE